jgi:hypothetical protein
MQLISILAPLVMLASFVAASPLEARGTHVTAVDAGKPESSPANATLKASVAAHIEGSPITAAVSKRTDFNALDKRYNPIIIVCENYNCGGPCFDYSLIVWAWQCYSTTWFNSVYLWNGGAGLPFGVWVGPNCNGSHSCHLFLGRYLISCI